MLTELQRGLVISYPSKKDDGVCLLGVVEEIGAKVTIAQQPLRPFRTSIEAFREGVTARGKSGRKFSVVGRLGENFDIESVATFNAERLGR